MPEGRICRWLKKTFRRRSRGREIDESQMGSRDPESAGPGEPTASSEPPTTNAEELPVDANQQMHSETSPGTAEEQPSSVSKDDTIDAWITNAQKVISVAVSCTSNVPIASQVLPPLQAIVDRLAETRANIREKKEVLEEIESLAKTIEAVGKGVHAQLSGITDGEGQDVMNEIGKNNIRFPELSGIAEDLQQLEISIKERPQRGQIGKVAYATQDAEFLKGVRAKISTIRENIQIQDGQLLKALLIDAVGHVRQQSGYLESMVHAQMEKDEREALEQLQPVHASYKADATEEKARLTEGTRAQILSDLETWARSEQPSHRVCVLHGHAGMGKSSIAHALCERLGGTYLGASFFFIRGQFDNPRSLFPSLAYQLAHRRSELRPSIIKAAKNYGRSGQLQRLKHQIKELLEQPLQTGMANPGPLILFVVDGIDECVNDLDDIVAQMLQLLCELASKIPSIRILLATRPEAYILRALKASGHSKTIISRDLQKEPDVDLDIRRFIDSEFEKCRQAGPFVLLRERPDAAKQLTNLSDGLFIYASTIIRFLIRDIHFAVRMYDTLIESQGRLGPGEAYKKLDMLYGAILTSAFGEINKDQGRMRHVLHILCWMCLRKSHSYVDKDNLSAFLPDAFQLEVVDIPSYITLDLIDRLRSVLIVDGDITPSTPIRACHASFPQFLMDPARCTDPAFLVDPPSGHALIAMSLLDLLARDDVDSLRGADGDMPQMWDYARLEWDNHLVEAQYTPELGRSLRRFVETHLEDSRWDEVGNTDDCARVRSWYEKNGPDDGLVPMLDEILDRRVKEIAAGANQLPGEFDWEWGTLKAWVKNRYPREEEQALVG